ncbi:hypothetical protein O9992_01150 [Vibrio lentus]|nr:hypothetical protein [Vibrio lentus]
MDGSAPRQRGKLDSTITCYNQSDEGSLRIEPTEFNTNDDLQPNGFSR